jgi:hypothetical protein
LTTEEFKEKYPELAKELGKWAKKELEFLRTPEGQKTYVEPTARLMTTLFHLKENNK